MFHIYCILCTQYVLHLQLCNFKYFTYPARIARVEKCRYNVLCMYTKWENISFYLTFPIRHVYLQKGKEREED